jgi:hypothetical protein
VNDALRVRIHDEEREDRPEPDIIELQEVARPILKVVGVVLSVS